MSRRRGVSGRFFCVLAILLTILGASPGNARAQTGGSSGVIHGTITDESGAALPGVTATLTSPAVQLPQIVVVSDGEGNYRFAQLPVGTYRITFELTGFNTFVREELRLPVGFIARVDVALKIGTLAESVTVTGDSPVIDTTSTTTSVNFTTETLNEIPRGRDLAMVYSMAPGVTLAGTPDVGGSNMANRQNIASEGVGLQPKLQIEGMNIVLSDDQNSGVYFNSDTLEEIQLRTSGNDAEVSTPGVSMVGVIKSGGNDFHGRYSYAYQTPKLQSSNLDDHLRSQGLTATQPMKKFYDYQLDLGGRLIRDKLWFYGAFSNQQKYTGITGFVANPGADGRYLTGDEPIQIAHTGLYQWSMKYSYQLSQNNRINYVWQRGTKFVGEDGAAQLRPLEGTTDYTNPCAINRVEFQRTLNSWSLFNVVGGYVGWWSDYSAERQQAKYGFEYSQPRFDRETQLNLGNSEQEYRLRPQDRYMIDAGYTMSPASFLGGKHEFKTGVTYYYDHEAWYYPGNKHYGNYRLFVDRVGGVSGVPVEIQINNNPVRPSDNSQLYAWYLKDSWRVTDRLTANLGVRWEYQHVYLPEQERAASPDFPTVYPAGSYPYMSLVEWTRTVPRAGLAWDGERLGVFKTTFGLYNYMFGAQRAANYNQNAGGNTTFRWTDRNGDRQYQPGEANLDLNGPDFVNRTGGISNVMNPDLKQPLTVEYTAGYEHALGQDLGFRTSYVFRRITDLYDLPGPNVLRPRSAYNIPITRRDPGADGVLGNTDDGGSVTFWDYDPAFRGAAFVRNIPENTPNVDKYHSMEFAVTKRPSKGWQGSAAVWMVKNHRWLTTTFDNPNNDFFPIDDTWFWAGNFNVSYRLPFDVLVAASLQAKQGAKGQRTVQFRTVDPDGGRPISQLSTVTLRMEPYGSQLGPALNVMNLRFAKDLRVGGNRRLGLDLDVFNLLNSNAPNQQIYVSGPTFLYATGVNGGILPPRIARFAARFSF